MVERDAAVLTAATIAMSTTWATRVAGATTPTSIDTLPPRSSPRRPTARDAVATEGSNITGLPADSVKCSWTQTKPEQKTSPERRHSSRHINDWRLQSPQSPTPQRWPP